MINYYGIENNRLTLLKPGMELFWIDITSPSMEEIEYIITKYDLPQDYIFDVRDPQEISRIEGVGELDEAKMIMLLYPYKVSDDFYNTRPISIILTHGIIITATSEKSSIINILKMDLECNFIDTKSREDFALEIAWKISQSFILAVRNLEVSISKVEKEMQKKSTKNELLFNMINIQKSLINFQMATRENGPILDTLYNANDIFVAEVREDLIRDLQVENKQAEIMVEKASTMLEHLSELYSNVISNNLNDVMKVLTSITIVLTIPTIISGLWGMNTDLPLMHSENAFYYLLAISAIISFLIIYYLKKRDYL